MSKAANQPKKETKKPVPPPSGFVHWWEPWGTDKATGASIGGHPDANRMWARPEPEGGHTRQSFGMTSTEAWNCADYIEQYREWKQLGCPTRKDFISIAATLERQKQFWIDLAPIVTMIGKDEKSKAKIRSEFKTDELVPKMLEKYPGVAPA